MTTSSHRRMVCEERQGTLADMSRALSLGTRRLELLSVNPTCRDGVGAERGSTCTATGDLLSARTLARETAE
eukprot:6526086-Prymnesium_polylepis.1